MQKVINILLSIVFLINVIGVTIPKNYLYLGNHQDMCQEANTCCSDMKLCLMADMSNNCGLHNQEDCSCSHNGFYRIINAFVTESYSNSVSKHIDLDSISIFSIMEIAMFSTSHIKTDLIHHPPWLETNVQSEYGVFLI
jgi:hypothetical protein